MKQSPDKWVVFHPLSSLHLRPTRGALARFRCVLRCLAGICTGITSLLPGRSLPSTGHGSPTHRRLEKLVDVLVTPGYRVWWLKKHIKTQKKTPGIYIVGLARIVINRIMLVLLLAYEGVFGWPFVFMTHEAHRKTTKTHGPSRGLSGRISSFWEWSLSLGKINLMDYVDLFEVVLFETSQ